MYDVIVIGAGLSGLSSALMLSKQGKKVLVLEKHNIVGGYANNFKRKDKNGNFYNFDTSLHGIGGLNEGGSTRFMLEKKLDVFKDITPLRKKEVSTIVLKNGEHIDIPDNIDDYRALLKDRYSDEAYNIDKLFDFLLDLKEDMANVISNNKAPQYFNSLQSITLYDFLKQYTDNENLIEEFSFLWSYYGLPPKKLNALYYLLPWISYHINGTYYIKGGAMSLSNAISDNIKKYGGEIILSEEVVKINVENDEITSLITKKGNEYKAETYIMACSPIHMLSLVDYDSEAINAYKKKLNELELSMSITQLYIGLDVKSTDVGIEKADYLFLQDSHENIYDSMLRGDLSKTGFSVTSYDVMDESLNPSDNVGVIAVSVGDFIHNWGEYKSDEYKEQKKKFCIEIINKLEKHFNGIKKHIKLIELGTPYTMRRYTNNTDGAVYGFSQCVGQGGFERLDYITPLKNTYLTGSFSNPGGGYEGVIISGVRCAEKIIKKQSNTNNAVENDENTYSEGNNLMDISAFMAGMLAGLNKDKAVGVDAVYHFNFSDQKDYFVEIKNCKAKILYDYSSKPDVTINTDYKTWYDISFGYIEGEDALYSGKMKIDGCMNTFMKIPEMFSTGLDDDVESDKEVFYKGGAFVGLALVPFILYWSISDFFSPIFISTISILYLTMFTMIVKPRKYREVTFLEGLGFISFALYGFMSISYNNFSYLPDIMLIFGSFFSAILNIPFTMEYSKMEYSERMVKTRLFIEINKVISLVWAGVWLLKLIIEIILPTPIDKVSLLLIIIGIVFSNKYPKHRLSV